MNEIKAIIQPFMLDAVPDALHQIEGLPGITVSESRAISTERGRYAQILKTKLEVMVPDSLAERVLQVIQQSAHTGSPGDGRVVIIPVEETVAIRTGQRGTAT